MEKEGIKIITNNRKASFNYFLSEFIEAGLVLTGTEIKSIRANKCSISDAYVVFKGNEAFLLNMNIIGIIFKSIMKNIFIKLNLDFYLIQVR